MFKSGKIISKQNKEKRKECTKNDTYLYIPNSRIKIKMVETNLFRGGIYESYKYILFLAYTIGI